MNLKRAKAMAKNFQEKDGRLSKERALSESIMREVIISLDAKDKIPSRYLTKKDS